MNDSLHWFKSSYSGSGGGECVEVAFDWRTSSYSDSSGGNCVEVAACPHSVRVRDSKVSDGPVFSVDTSAWSAFLSWQS
ncbi:DUF397 domain-containing protein [Streptomyces sp. SCSIO 30461]|uniref:DUF397 domain-containing protein n=1 Tax=Streptomyces sp. SCSIO 30461 TaxID=3118085 RepID=UPI0030D3B492